MSEHVLDVTVRDNPGTGGARAARRDGLVPGVLYGGKKGSVPIAMKQNEIIRALNAGELISKMVTISHNGEEQTVLTRDIQFHPVSDMPVHVDFYRVDEDSIITVEVSVSFVGEDQSPGLKRGGALNVVRHVIEVNCPAGSIPEELIADISEMDIGDTLHESDLPFPKGVKPAITDRDPTVATLMAARTESVDQGDDGEEADAEATEGEGADSEGGDED